MNGELYQPWQEAIERNVAVPPAILRRCWPRLWNCPSLSLKADPLSTLREGSRRPHSWRLDQRTRQRSAGAFESARPAIDQELFKVTVRVKNLTFINSSQRIARDHALMRVFGFSAHPAGRR